MRSPERDQTNGAGRRPAPSLAACTATVLAVASALVLAPPPGPVDATTRPVTASAHTSEHRVSTEQDEMQEYAGFQLDKVRSYEAYVARQSEREAELARLHAPAC